MYVQLAIAGAAAIAGYVVGSGLTAGSYERRLHTQAVEYAEGWKSAVEAANTAAEAQRKRDVAQAEVRGKRSVAAKEVIHEIQTATTDCVWTPDDSVRINKLYAAYGYNPDGSPVSVSDTVPAAAE